MTVTSSPPESLIGRELAGRYRIVELIAEGGMAIVYRALLDGGPREVALKVLIAELARDRTFALRFEREARLVGQLSHPRIVRLLDHGQSEGFYFMALELLDGEDLFTILERARMLHEAIARRIVIEVCEALAEAHGLGIVHRDMKLENVFVSRGPYGELGVKLLDFGVAKMREADGLQPQAVLTAVGALVGTPEYMAPEQCRGEAPGPLADVYACGVLLYVLLTGRAPFTAKLPMDVILKHITEVPVPPSTMRPDISPALDSLILSVLAKDPRARPPSAAALAEALRALGPAPALTSEALGLAPPKRPPPAAATLAPRVDPAADAHAHGMSPPAQIAGLPAGGSAQQAGERPPPAAPAAPPPVPVAPNRPLFASWQLVALLVALLIGAAAGRFSTLIGH